MVSRTMPTHTLSLSRAVQSVGCCLALSWLMVSAQAAPTVAAAPITLAVDDGHDDWGSLSPQERQVLAPLAAQWPDMSPDVRDKWTRVARRHPSLTPAAQAKVQERMKQWAQTSPQQRGEARLRFQNARELPAQQRQEQWRAYQALSPQEKADLAQQAQRKQKPVSLRDSEAGPRELTQATAAKARANRSANNSIKTNTVPSPGQVVQARTQAVSPALIKAGPGATTSLVTQAVPQPPLHQHTGLPKIAATKAFVDPQTMLPRKGSQSAAMTPLPPATDRPAHSR